MSPKVNTCWNVRVLVAALTLSLLSACKVPEDPEGTTEAVTGQHLRIGALTQALDPVEAQALSRLAQVLGAEQDVVTGDPHTLFSQLETGELHVIAGRIPANTPFAADVALTDPLGRVKIGADREDRVLAIRKGENRFLVTVNRAIREVTNDP